MREQSNSQDFFWTIYYYNHKLVYICTSQTVRGGAEVARWAHNPKVIGSSPIPATNRKPRREPRFLFLWPLRARTKSGQKIKTNIAQQYRFSVESKLPNKVRGDAAQQITAILNFFNDF